MKKSPFASGGCACGAITYTATAAPRIMSQCHCRNCQKATGTGHISLAFFAKEYVSIRGQATGYTTTADSGSQITLYFCPTCGSLVHGLNSVHPRSIGLTVGCMDDHSWFSPQAVVYTKHRNDWDITRTDIPNFTEKPPPR